MEFEKGRTPPDGSYTKFDSNSADDNTVLLVDFGDSTFGMIDSTYCVKASKSPSLEIFGSRGTITFLGGKEAPFVMFLDNAEKNVRGWMNPVVNLPNIKQSCGVEDLIEAIENGREPTLKVEHALHVIEIIEKAILSTKESKALELKTIF